MKSGVAGDVGHALFYWKEEAERYAKNAAYWREKVELMTGRTEY